MIKRLKIIAKSILKKIHGVRLDFRIHHNLSRIKKKISIGKKINIVFIVQFSEMWNSLKSVYESLINNKSYNLVLLAVPRYKYNGLEKGMKENEFYSENDAFDFLNKSGYDVVDAITNGGWKRLKDFNPDFIFYQRPYQPHLPREYNFSKVSKYALVCFFPYGVLLSKDIHIKVNVNEDMLKSAYIFFTDDKLAKEYFEENRYSKYSTAKLIKNPRFDLFSIDDVVKINYKPQCFLWTPRWYVGKENNKSNFALYFKPLVSFFDKHKDLKLIIRPHPLMFKNYVDRGVMTQSEIDDLIKEINSKKNISFDFNKDYRKTFQNADVLISDFSSLIIEYFLTGKPIVYCGETDDFNDLGKMISKYFICVDNVNLLLNNVKKLSEEVYTLDSERLRCIKDIINNKNKDSVAKAIEHLTQFHALSKQKNNR